MKTRIIQPDAALVTTAPGTNGHARLLCRVFLFTAVVGYVILGAVHPAELAVGDDSTLYVGIHVVQPVLILFLGWGVWLLVEGVPGRAAQVARVAILPYAIVYSMFDAIAGIAIGRVVSEANGMSAADGAAIQRLLDGGSGGTDVIGFAIYVLSGLTWFAMASAAAVAVRGIGGRGPTALMLVGAAIFAVGHPYPPGPIGIALFGLGLVWLELRRSAAETPAARAVLAP
jgi:hypothetical protein